MPTTEDALKARRDELVAQLAPLEAKREELLSKIGPLEAELSATNELINAIKRPELAELERILGPKLR